MRRALAMTALALGVFLIVLLIYLPAGWVSKLLPAQAQCLQPSGSLWHGRCAQLAVAGRSFGDVSWNIHAAALLRLRVAADVQLSGPLGTAQGDLELGTGNQLAARNVEADLALDPMLMPGLPANWTGRLQARVAELRTAAGHIEALRGTLQAHDIIANGPQPASFGSYELAFKEPPAGDGSLHGVLRDLGGPVSLQANAMLRGNAWQIDGLIAARPDANAQVARQLQYLGSPDAQGRRPFSAAGTF